MPTIDTLSADVAEPAAYLDQWVEMAGKLRAEGLDDESLCRTLAAALDQIMLQVGAISPKRMAEMLAVAVVRLTPRRTATSDADEFVARLAAPAPTGDADGTE